MAIIAGIILAIVLSIPSLKFSITGNYQVAIPRFGVIQCVDKGDWLSFKAPRTQTRTETDWSYTGVSDVRGTNNNYFVCPSSSLRQTIHIDVLIDGNEVIRKDLDNDYGSHNIDFSSIHATRGQSLTIRAYCTYPLNTGAHSLDDSSFVTLQKKDIMLEEAWAGSLPQTPIPDSEGCISNAIMGKYLDGQTIDHYIDPSTGKVVYKPDATYKSVKDMPTNWRVGDSYIFVKDWQTGIADISLVYDKKGNAYWCGGLAGNRKLYNMQKVTSYTGNVYLVPTSIEKSVECCSPADCSFKGAGYTCDMDTFTCKQEGTPCYSDLTCAQAFSGQSTCMSNEMTYWKCDTTKPQGYYPGTCVKTEKHVKDCPQDCNKATEYWDEASGECKPLYNLQDCPPGYCCLAGGSYKPKGCSFGQTCCLLTGEQYKGVCKNECSKPTTCEFDSDCNDNNPCTTDKCVRTLTGKKCVNEEIPGCKGGAGFSLKTSYIWASLIGLLSFLIVGKDSIHKRDWVGIIISLIVASLIALAYIWFASHWKVILGGSILLTVLGGVVVYFFGGVLLTIALFLKSIVGTFRS